MLSIVRAAFTRLFDTLVLGWTLLRRLVRSVPADEASNSADEGSGNMQKTLSFISAKWIPFLWKQLAKIRSEREAQLREIADTFGNPDDLARYYVEPNCQHHNPADHPEDAPISFVRAPIFNTINVFLNGEFQAHDALTGKNQMFVLSDAGMGKTSFLIMLRLTYLTAFWPQRYHCELLKLGADTLGRIEVIKDKRNTVLLLLPRRKQHRNDVGDHSHEEVVTCECAGHNNRDE